VKLRIILATIIFATLLGVQSWAGSSSGTVVMDFDLSGQEQGEEVKLWIPYPVSGQYQSVTGVRINGDYAESAVYTDNKFETPMLYVRWNKSATSRKLSFEFAVDRQEVAMRDLPSVEAAWNPSDYAIYLEPTRLGPIDGAVKELADSITKGETTLIGKAKAIYDWMCENTYRNPETRGCGQGDVCQLIKDPGGKCSDLSSMFVSLLRASGVPAREVFGIRQGKSANQDITTWQHCWSEFFVPGYGWVPADPADVRKMMLKHDLKLTDARTDEYRDYYWGGVDPYRIKLGEGRDLTLTPAQEGEPVNYLMYPHAQVGGKTIDWLDPANFKYTITYTQPVVTAKN